MPITVEFRKDENIAITHLIGNMKAEDIDETMRTQLAPFIQASAGRVDLIFDITQFDWDFQQFIAYLGMVAERRKQAPAPPNLYQHYIGRNDWMNNYRTWMYKRYGEQISTFANLEDALTYIQSAKEKADMSNT